MLGLIAAEAPTIAMSARGAEVAGELQDRLIALAVTTHVDQVLIDIRSWPKTSPRSVVNFVSASDAE